MRIFENLKIDFLGKRKIFYVVSAVFFLLGVGSIIFRGLHLGIDFKGGTEIVCQFEKPIDITNMRNELSTVGLGDVEVVTFGDETGALIRTDLQQIPANIYPQLKQRIENEIDAKFPGLQYSVVDTARSTITYHLDNPDTTEAVVDELFLSGFQTGRIEENNQISMIVRIGISDWIKIKLHELVENNEFQVLREDKVGPKIGDELKQGAIIAVVLSLIVILLYLGFRFKFIFAMGAVAALFHDVLITLGLFSLLYGIFPFLNLEVDLTVVAAFLTLVGYSINDTVVVFDRVRENLKLHKTMDIKELLNMSINRTMSRTILTGVTTLLAILILLLFGGEVLRAFSFTLFFGIIIGTYSSIFVASALVLEYAKRSDKKVEF